MGTNETALPDRVRQLEDELAELRTLCRDLGAQHLATRAILSALGLLIPALPAEFERAAQHAAQAAAADADTQGYDAEFRRDILQSAEYIARGMRAAAELRWSQKPS